MKYIIFLIIFLFPLTVLCENGTIYTIKKGEKAPCDGVLLDTDAAAYILAEDNYDANKCDVECKEKVEIERAQGESVVKSLEISLEYERTAHLQTILEYGSELRSMNELLRQEPEDDDDLMWSMIGASGGVVVTSIIFGVIMGAL